MPSNQMGKTTCRNRSAHILVHMVQHKGDDERIFKTPIFATKMFRMLGYHAKEARCPPARVGGWIDHVHVLCGLSRTVTVAQFGRSHETGNVEMGQAGRPEHVSLAKRIRRVFGEPVDCRAGNRGTTQGVALGWVNIGPSA